MKRIAVYSYYDPKGLVEFNSLETLYNLKTVCDDIIIVINGELDNYSLLQNISDKIVIRENNSYDFGAYRDVIMSKKYQGIISGCDELVFCNNSFFGPFIPFGRIFATMDNPDIDFWGLSHKKSEWGEHIQSYFLVIKRIVWEDGYLFDFINNHTFDNMSYYDVCSIFENGLFRFLSEKGYRYGSYAMDIVYEPYTNPFEFMRIEEVPILKKKIFDKKYYNRNEIACSLSYVFHNYAYDVSLISNYADRYYDVKIESDEYCAKSKNYNSPEIGPLNRMAELRDRIFRFINDNGSVYFCGQKENCLDLYSHIISFPNNPLFAGFINLDEIINIHGYASFDLDKLNKNAPIIVPYHDESSISIIKEKMQEYRNTLYINDEMKNLRERKIIVFGTGKYFETRKELFNIEQIECFVDNSPYKIGTKLYDRDIISVDDLCNRNYSYILLMSVHSADMREQLLNIGIERDKILEYRDALPFLLANSKFKI